jgi:hypothetical protein
MPRHPLSIPDLADSLLDDLRCAAREDEPVDFLRNVSGPGARAWLFALADRTAVKAWLAAQHDPIDLAACFSPGQDLLSRYLVSLLPDLCIADPSQSKRNIRSKFERARTGKDCKALA